MLTSKVPSKQYAISFGSIIVLDETQGILYAKLNSFRGLVAE